MRGRKLPPATLAKPDVKQLSQVRSAIDSTPSRSDTWVTLVQKQVGHTSVQFAHDRHRSAISAHWGLSAAAIRRAGRPAVGTGSPIRSRAAATATRASDCCASLASGSASWASRSSPAAVPERTTNPSSSSVSARSNPLVTSGPVFIEVQKQVLAGASHSTAITIAAPRRAT